MSRPKPRELLRKPARAAAEIAMTKLQDSQAGSVSHTRETRLHPRRKLAQMAYVELAQDNGGILLNLGEGGLAVQSALALSSQEFPGFRFQLPHTQGWLRASGRVAWMSESKKEAGIQFLDLHEHARAQIRAWVAKEGEPEPGKDVQAPAMPDQEQPPTEIRSQSFAPKPKQAAGVPMQEDRSFEFNNYSMFAGDVGTGSAWFEPAPRRSSWRSYALFTIVLAALLFVLGATFAHGDFNQLLASIRAWKQNQTEPPVVIPPAPPVSEEAGTHSEQNSASQQNSDQQENVQEQQKAPAEPNSAQKPGQEEASADRLAEKDQAEKTEASPAMKSSVSTPAGKDSTSAARTKTQPRSSYAKAEAADPSEYGRSILVSAPPPGSPPFFVNLPGEAVSASPWVAITARRTIQVPPRGNAREYGSERVIIGKLIAHSDPFYPMEARDKHIEGSVELHAVVGRTGQVISVTPVSGPAVLAAAAATALHEWRYEPTFIDGDPVETHVDVTMVFRSP
jgi:TonB family protein